jgi:hypothetical protein
MVGRTRSKRTALRSKSPRASELSLAVEAEEPTLRRTRGRKTRASSRHKDTEESLRETQEETSRGVSSNTDAERSDGENSTEPDAENEDKKSSESEPSKRTRAKSRSTRYRSLRGKRGRYEKEDSTEGEGNTAEHESSVEDADDHDSQAEKGMVPDEGGVDQEEEKKPSERTRRLPRRLSLRGSHSPTRAASSGYQVGSESGDEELVSDEKGRSDSSSAKAKLTKTFDGRLSRRTSPPRKFSSRRNKLIDSNEGDHVVAEKDSEDGITVKMSEGDKDVEVFSTDKDKESIPTRRQSPTTLKTGSEKVTEHTALRGEMEVEEDKRLPCSKKVSTPTRRQSITTFEKGSEKITVDTALRGEMDKEENEHFPCSEKVFIPESSPGVSMGDEPPGTKNGSFTPIPEEAGKILDATSSDTQLNVSLTIAHSEEEDSLRKLHDKHKSEDCTVKPSNLDDSPGHHGNKESFDDDPSPSLDVHLTEIPETGLGLNPGNSATASKAQKHLHENSKKEACVLDEQGHKKSAAILVNAELPGTVQKLGRDDTNEDKRQRLSSAKVLPAVEDIQEDELTNKVPALASPDDNDQHDAVRISKPEVKEFKRVINESREAGLWENKVVVESSHAGDATIESIPERVLDAQPDSSMGQRDNIIDGGIRVHTGIVVGSASVHPSGHDRTEMSNAETDTIDVPFEGSNFSANTQNTLQQQNVIPSSSTQSVNASDCSQRPPNQNLESCEADSATGPYTGKDEDAVFINESKNSEVKVNQENGNAALPNLEKIGESQVSQIPLRCSIPIDGSFGETPTKSGSALAPMAPVPINGHIFDSNTTRGTRIAEKLDSSEQASGGYPSVLEKGQVPASLPSAAIDMCKDAVPSGISLHLADNAGSTPSGALLLDKKGGLPSLDSSNDRAPMPSYVEDLGTDASTIEKKHSKPQRASFDHEPSATSAGSKESQAASPVPTHTARADIVESENKETSSMGDEATDFKGVSNSSVFGQLSDSKVEESDVSSRLPTGNAVLMEEEQAFKSELKLEDTGGEVDISIDGANLKSSGKILLDASKRPAEHDLGPGKRARISDEEDVTVVVEEMREGEMLLSDFPFDTHSSLKRPPSKLESLKLRIFSAGTAVHRGRGYEKLFGKYWGALSRRLEGRLSRTLTDQCQAVINAFLKSKRLQKLHNKLIFGTCAFDCLLL